MDALTTFVNLAETGRLDIEVVDTDLDLVDDVRSDD
jgi:hypothetical protein